MDKCCICGKEAFGNGCSTTLYSVSESGKIKDMTDDGLSSMQVVVPLCGYHLVLMGEGIICLTTQKTILTRNNLEYYEKKSEKELKEIIEASLKHEGVSRSQINKQSKITDLKIAITIDSAREFQKAMEQTKTGDDSK